jgi:cytochrome c biogenesis protein CcmG/thiol:disulfide interchange protein DsbE
MPRLLLFIPLALFIALSFFLWKGLSIDPRKLPSALIDKPFPEFQVLLVSPC